MVKAVADERGLEHRHHAVLIRLTHDLAIETGGPELQDLFDSANTLHGNFYEDKLTREEIERRLHRVAMFVNRVERLLRTPNR